MLTFDLPELFGIMARPTNRKVRVKDLQEFDDWLHVSFDPIVVKVYVGNGKEERKDFKDQLVTLLQAGYGMALTCNRDSLTLSRNQVNIHVWAMLHALHDLGARICQVQFFGMKWEISVVEPKIDHFIERYHVEMGSFVPLGKNMFDYGILFLEKRIHLYKFSDAQRDARNFVEGHVSRCAILRDMAR